MSQTASDTASNGAARSAKLEGEATRIRRKSRDLEADFFGMTINEHQNMKQTFAEFDTDNSGGVSQSELKEALKKLKDTVVPSDRILRKMIQFFSRKDFKDGKELDEDAFTKLVSATKDGSFEAKIKAEDDKYEALFTSIDTDNSKSISHAELKTALAQVPGSSSADLTTHWDRIIMFADKTVEGCEEKEFTFDAFQKLLDEIFAGKFDVVAALVAAPVAA